MHDSYDDIKHLTRPQYDALPPMPMSDRAAQFSPFAALVGYGDAVAETARLVDSKAELTEDSAAALNESLNRLLAVIDERPTVKLTYFIPDERKSGGRYITKTGEVRIYDSYKRELVFTDGTRAAVEDMAELTFADEQQEKQF